MTLGDLLETLKGFNKDADIYIYDVQQDEYRQLKRVFIDVDDYVEHCTSIDNIYLI